MLPKPSDIKPYEDETLERIQFEHLYIAMIILEAGIIISMLVFLGEMAWFARRLKKTGIEEAMTENNNMAEDNYNTNEDDYTMDEKKYAAWKRWCKYFCVVLIAALPFCIAALSYHIHILIQAEQELTTTSTEDNKKF